VDEFEIEHEKLIKAWKNTKEVQIPKLEDIYIATQISDNLPIVNGQGFREGRRHGIQVCYDYIIKNIRK
jgi:hypothetical protein